MVSSMSFGTWCCRMAERPAIQLYFGDFEGNEKVKRCTWSERGVLLYVMGLFHRSEEYGALRWRLKEIASAIGAPLALVKALVEKRAIKGSDVHVEAYRWAPRHAGKRGPEVLLVPEQDGPLWYSSRMVRDEYKRTNRGISTRFQPGGNNPQNPPNPREGGPPSRGDGDEKGEPNGTPTQREGDGASSSASTSLPKRSVVLTPTDTARANGANGHGAIEKSEEKQNGDIVAAVASLAGKMTAHRAKGQEWDNPAWVEATGKGLDPPIERRTNELWDEFRDRVFEANRQRMAKAKREEDERQRQMKAAGIGGQQ